MTTGERIKARRIELGLNADQLAEIVGVNRATIYRYENGGIENMSTDVLRPLADALHTTPTALMGWEEQSSSTGATPNDSKLLQTDLNGSEQTLIDNYRQLNQEGQEALLGVSEAYTLMPQYKKYDPAQLGKEA